jgi:hypothetical protein
MKRYYGSDYWVVKHDIEPEEKGDFDHDKMTEEEAIARAIKGRIPVITKGGFEGRWYFKGKDESHDILEQRLENNKGKERYERCYAILIKYD